MAYVIYEWTVETFDENGDIEDVDFSTRLKDLTIPDEKHDLGLVRRVGDDASCEVDRDYCYINNNTLPEYFENTSYKVPKKHRKEFELYLKIC